MCANALTCMHVHSAFCSIQALSELNDGHPHWRVSSGLLSPLIQMLISSGNTQKYLIRAPSDPVNLTCKINHHTLPEEHLYFAAYALVLK